MTVKFDKMHALGNDFVMIDSSKVSDESMLTKKFFRNISDRIFGIGCDLVIVYRYENGTVFASFFNRDGSEAEICGNGARCLGLLMNRKFGLKECILKTKKRSYQVHKEENISVNMGVPDESPSAIGLNGDLLTLELDYCESRFCASVGNPHLVLFLTKTPSIQEINSIGARLESHPIFKYKINVSFAVITTKNEIQLSVFERGVGLTFACGSGACATAYLAYKNKLVNSKDILVYQKGGVLKISIDDKGNIWQAGPATYVFCGEI